MVVFGDAGTHELLRVVDLVTMGLCVLLGHREGEHVADHRQDEGWGGKRLPAKAQGGRERERAGEVVRGREGDEER